MTPTCRLRLLCTKTPARLQPLHNLARGARRTCPLSSSGRRFRVKVVRSMPKLSASALMERAPLAATATSTATCVARSSVDRSASSYARVTARAAMRVLWRDLIFVPHTRAREIQAERFVDEIPFIADDGRNDFMERTRRNGETFISAHADAAGIADPTVRVDEPAWRDCS